MEKKYDLEVTIRVANNRGLVIGKTVYMFNEPRVVVGLWNSNIVFAKKHPKTMMDCRVLIYTIDEVCELVNEGKMERLVFIYE